jgi:hypothetical protein
MGHDKQSATYSLDMSLLNQAASKRFCFPQRDPQTGKLRPLLDGVVDLKNIQIL